MFFAAPESIKTNRVRVAIYYGEMPTKADENAGPATPPDSSSLSVVREAAEDCTACHLSKRAEAD